MAMSIISANTSGSERQSDRYRLGPHVEADGSHISHILLVVSPEKYTSAHEFRLLITKTDSEVNIQVASPTK